MAASEFETEPCWIAGNSKHANMLESLVTFGTEAFLTVSGVVDAVNVSRQLLRGLRGGDEPGSPDFARAEPHQRCVAS